MIDTGHHAVDRPRQRGRLLQGDGRPGGAGGDRLPEGARGRHEGGPGDGLRRPARPRLGQDRLRHRLDAGRASPASTSSSEPGFRRVLQVSEGKLDDLAEPGTILIFDKQAEKLGVKVGDAITISAPTTPRHQQHHRRARGGDRARASGCSAPGTPSCPIDSLRALYQLNQDATGVIHPRPEGRRATSRRSQARLRDGARAGRLPLMDPDPRAFWMKFQSVNREDWTGQKLDVTTWEDEISFMTVDAHRAAGGCRSC